MVAYATRADVYRYGLPRGLLANPARLCASVLAATDQFELDGHGFENDDSLIFRAEAGGQLPAPIVAGLSYPAIRVNDSIFQVADGAGGPAIDLTSDGISVVVAMDLPWDAILESCSRWVEDFLPGHLVPFPAPYPARLIDIVAELAAERLLMLAHQSSKTIKDVTGQAKAQMERWIAGLPMRDPRATASANLALSGNAADVDPRGRFIP